MRVLCATALVLSVLCFSGLIHAEDKPWVEVRSAHFWVITNGEQSDGRRVLQRFELMRAVFASQFPRFKLDAPAPLLIIAARDESTTRKLLPEFPKGTIEFLGGLYKHGWEREYALVRLDKVKADSDSYSIVYHEYVHSLLHINFRWLPSWLDEGMAEFYGYTGLRRRQDVHWRYPQPG